jgi:hypothetical protein
MKTNLMTRGFVLIATLLATQFGLAQDSTLPFSAEERESVYVANIAKRTSAILEVLALSDVAKSNAVHGIIMNQYRALKGRDDALDPLLFGLSKAAPGTETNRLAVIRLITKPLHDAFLAKLMEQLTPEQIEKVKDRMTYNRAQVTYDTYCAMLPALTDKDKAKIQAALKEAREEAMDGGSADEKAAIFKRHKDPLNAYLNSQGYDVAKATKEWEAKQKSESAATAVPTTK